VISLRTRETAVLAGAGISVNAPASLPAGWPFMDALLRAIAPTLAVRERLARAGSYRDAPLLSGAFLRFESLLERIAAEADRELRLLDAFDARAPHPHNALHAGLARIAAGGAIVCTTNFDALIEAAARSAGTPLKVRCRAREFRRFTPRGGELLKLHGSFVDGRGRDARASLKATIATVGRVAIGLDRAVSGAFEEMLRTRDLVVAGYSGLDDFDISDLIARTASTKQVIWIRHASQPRVRIHRWRSIIAMHAREKSGRRPSRELEILTALGERGLRRHDDIVLVEGPTDAALRRLWPAQFERVRATDPPDARNSRAWLAAWFEQWAREVVELDTAGAWLLCGTIFDELLNDRPAAARCYEAAARHAKGTRQKMIAIRNLVGVETDRERFPQAAAAARRLARLENAHRVSRDDRAHSANILGRLAEARARNAGDFAAAARHFRTAWRLGDERMRCTAAHNLGFLFLIRGDTAAAREWLERSLRLARGLGMIGAVADAYAALARVADRERRRRTAASLLEKSRTLFERLGIRDGELDVILYQLESVDSGDADDATLESAIARGLEVAGSDYERAVVLRAIAEVRRHQQKFSEARRLLRRSEAIVRRLGINDFLPAVLSARGFLEAEAGRLDRAEDALLEALQACRVVGESVIRSDVVYKLAELAYGRGDLATAQHFIREAIALNEPIGDPVWCADCYLLAAAIANDAGDTRGAKAAAAMASRWERRIPKG
jgi:tetratricopeptide (TPR) repeat protein